MPYWQSGGTCQAGAVLRVSGWPRQNSAHAEPQSASLQGQSLDKFRNQPQVLDWGGQSFFTLALHRQIAFDLQLAMTSLMCMSGWWVHGLTTTGSFSKSSLLVFFHF